MKIIFTNVHAFNVICNEQSFRKVIALAFKVVKSRAAKKTVANCEKRKKEAVCPVCLYCHPEAAGRKIIVSLVLANPVSIPRVLVKPYL